MFTDKVVIITGVSQGIGQALAEGFQKEGAKLAGIDLHPCTAPLDLFMQGDIAQQAVLEDFANQVLKKFGQVDILINNAMLTRGGISTCSYEDFLYIQKIGLAAPYYLSKLLSPRMAQDAHILNLSSSRAFQSQHDTESYSAAKGGITALTHALAVSLSGKVRVNAIAPGWIDTTNTDFTGADNSQHPAGRVGKPQDIVNAALFLCSDKAAFITGQTLLVDGGMSKLMVYHNDEGWAFEG